MNDNEILSDAFLLVFKQEAEQRRRSNFHDNAPRYVPIQAEELLALVARLERAESMLRDFDVKASEQMRKLMAETARLAIAERDEVLKCLAEAPALQSEECAYRHSKPPCTKLHVYVDEEKYAAWYTSPARQNLLKGVK